MSTPTFFQVALPNKGALSDESVRILQEAGYKCHRYSRELVVRDATHEVEFVYLRPRDIAIYVGTGVIQAGITGRDLALDSQANTQELLALNLGKSRFCYAIPAEKNLTPDQFHGLRIATSYPNIVQADLDRRQVRATIVRLDGAVEISIQLGVADAIADVVESGRTLTEAGLKITGEPVLRSEAILITRNGAAITPPLQALMHRIEGILVARAHVLVEYDIPKAQLAAACKITPGVQSPTISPLNDENWVAVSALVKTQELNPIMDQIKALGGRAIIAHAIRTCRF